MHANFSPCPIVWFFVHPRSQVRAAPVFWVALPQHTACTAWVKGDDKPVVFFTNHYITLAACPAQMAAHPLHCERYFFPWCHLIPGGVTVTPNALVRCEDGFQHM